MSISHLIDFLLIGYLSLQSIGNVRQVMHFKIVVFDRGIVLIQSLLQFSMIPPPSKQGYQKRDREKCGRCERTQALPRFSPSYSNCHAQFPFNEKPTLPAPRNNSNCGRWQPYWTVNVLKRSKPHGENSLRQTTTIATNCA